MRKKFTMLLALLSLCVGTAWAQKAHQRVSHDGWVVTALNEAGVYGNEGGVAFIADDNPATFYHSNWNNNYSDGNSVKKGQDGLQAFMVELPTSLSDLSLITYKGRSDNNTSGWARGVRVYVFETLPEDWPTGGLSSLGYVDKQALLASTNVNLGAAAFDNTGKLWTNDRTQKLVEFATPQTGKYVLFIMESGHDSWLTCADFQIYQYKDYTEIVEEKPYFLQVTNAKASGMWFVDTYTNKSGTAGGTIAISAESRDTYFHWDATSSSWLISKDVDGNFLKANNWDINPQESSSEGTGWELFVNDNETISLLQRVYDGGSDNSRCFVGGDVVTSESAVNLYTDAAKDKAINLQLIDASAKPVTVTYSLTYGGVEKYTQTVETFSGEEYPEISVTFPYGITATKPAGEIDANDVVEGAITKTIELQSSLPFEYADSYAAVEAGEYWYYLKFNSNQNYYLHHDAGQNYIDLASKAVDKANKDIYSWGFVGNPFEGFQVVNRAAGATMILSSSTTMSNETEADIWPIMTTTPVPDGHNTIWQLTESAHATNGFFMAQDGHSNNKLNDRGKLAYWTTGAGAGSTFVAEARVMGAVADLEDLLVDAKALQATVNENIGTVIGEYTQETADALGVAIVAAETKVEAETATADDFTALMEAIDAVNVILPTPGQYYQFHSSLGFANTKAVYSDGTNAAWKTFNEYDKSFFWQAVATDDGGVVLKNAKDGKYMKGHASQSGEWSMVDEYSDASKIDIKILDKGEDAKGYRYGVILNGWQMHCNGHSNGGGDASTIVSYNGDKTSASSWYIQEVDLPNSCMVTYNFLYEGEVKYTQVTEVLIDGAYPAMDVFLPYGVASDFALPEGTISDNVECNFILTIEKELPFTTYDSYANVETWYYMPLDATGKYYLSYTADQTYIPLTDAQKTLPEAEADHDAYLWAFVGDIFSGFKIMNKAAGSTMILSSSTTMSGTEGGGTYPLMKVETEVTEGENTYWLPTVSTNAENGFYLAQKDYPDNRMNNRSNKLAYWTGGADKGSTFRVTTLVTEEALGEYGVAELLAKAGKVGYPKTTSSAYTALSAVTSASNVTVLDMVESLIPAYKRSTDISLPEDGKAYTIANYSLYNGGTTRYLNYTEGSALSVQEDEANVSVFVARQLSNGVYAFVTKDGKVLTWISDVDGYREEGVYNGYSTYYGTEYNGYSDWNKITVKKNGSAEGDFGMLRLVARRNAQENEPFSSFIIKGADGSWDKASDSYFFGNSDGFFSSAWLLTEVAHDNTEAQTLALAKIDKVNALGSKNVAEGIGNYHYVVDGEICYAEALNAATTVDEVNAIAATIAINQPAAGFYRVKSMNSNSYPGNKGKCWQVNAEGTGMELNATADQFNSIIYIDEDNKFVSYGCGDYLNHHSNITVAAEGKAWSILENAQVIGTYALDYPDGGNWCLSDWTGGVTYGQNDANAAWIFEEVTTLPVAVSAVGFATLYAPVALEIPDGVTAYIGVQEDNYLALTDIEDVTDRRVIPANTGVVLEATANTYNFTVATGEYSGLDKEQNLLTGAYPKSEKEANKKVYTLQNGDNGVGFYLFKGYTDENDQAGTKTYINGFRAWVELPLENNARALALRFRSKEEEGEGGTTSIDNGQLTIDREDAVIYDLQGRRVLNPTKGMYIVNGKKVLF